jgi:hypothetical protein
MLAAISGARAIEREQIFQRHTQARSESVQPPGDGDALRPAERSSIFSTVVSTVVDRELNSYQYPWS